MVTPSLLVLPPCSLREIKTFKIRGLLLRMQLSYMPHDDFRSPN
ncbi:hypothetical protein FHU12_0891 [Serratia marcescens]|uniref:Uncharacterized protein n=1 Tax=Serratia marcescens TaxID=615 RepID=A0AA46QAW9_SERMA|nr:hypothetical protein FHU12_0891 [Serratia marcescens]